MAVSVLGKRQRGAIETEAPTLPLRSSNRRRTQPPRILQEVNEPSASSTRQLRSRTRNGTYSNQENDSSIKITLAETDKTKHVVRVTKTASPSKIGPEPRTSEVVNDENTKPIEFKTPSKSRYRDALESPPVTPKHRVQVGGKSMTPRTPRQISSPSSSQTIYTAARQLFTRGATSGRLIGRDAEREKLTSFIQERVTSRKGGCLYVSGPPGTGKSAMVREVCNGLGLDTVQVAHINCASMRGPRDVYSKLIEDLGDDGQVFRKSDVDRLKALFLPDKKHDGLFLVTLDEIDHLLTADAGVLQSLFEWSLNNKSRLLLIGIANALDLTDRSLPQLKAKNLKPCLLPFLPYNASQIANVITNRLRSLLPPDQDVEPTFVPFVQPAAIQLCAKKVASQTGDLRKAFELVKCAIDLIEQETLQKLEKQSSSVDSASKTILVENNNLSSPARTSISKQNPTTTYTILTAPRASIGHIARITSSAFGQGTVQRLQALNLQQKAALCSLLALDRKRRESDLTGTPSKIKMSAPTIKQIFDTYCTLCRKDNILHPLTATEFKDVISNLETLGLVGEFQGRGRGGTVSGGSDIRRTPSKSGCGMMSPRKGMDEQGLVCFVSQKEIESQIAGPGEGILRRLLMGEGL
ncbi:AAA family ATPase CDC6 [Aspergillus fischeri NRRL 181]|uniref:Cell division control protein n=1 Tax=Neosartorya fischeri (strain ATCC 1020 / DSM 3700 / CBS 544.65 / FGSC A1164 / JCM 1740 / NRRL 181 / WB 181) TaxID=331117 RepID=A1DC96_NEOFI|nr:cell division control protein Cdc6, putative [Aspergillus fischeri NRRL 181]EAW19456.1 cell division control protein Cdc6, putative [Aspergillus fischeri NRRL 181]